VAGLAIVTRPGEAGERLVERISHQGGEAIWWPAFQIGSAPEESAAGAALGELAGYDLAIFVSPAAVRAVAGLLRSAWPTPTAIGAVGDATAQEVAETLGPPLQVPVVAPTGERAGSEAFWEEWQQSGRTARRVLILRAQAGREWLAERFTETGAQVVALTVYTRTETVPDQPKLDRLAAAVRAQEPVAILFTSSESIEAFDRQVAGVPGAAAWLRQGRAVASHPRIAERLLAAGYTRVEVATSDHERLMSQL
jgi:uroporphyrinogen-III synthase